MIYEAMGVGNMPNLRTVGDFGGEPLSDELTDGVYSIDLKWYGDAPTVPLITVLATTEEKAVSAYEALRAALKGLELFPGGTHEDKAHPRRLDGLPEAFPQFVPERA